MAKARIERAQAFTAIRGAEVLGTRAASEIEYLQLVEKGLPPAAIERLQKAASLSEAEMDEIIPRRTRNRQRLRARLSREQSDRIARAADIYVLAYEVFGDREKANGWMGDPNPALQGETPLSLLGTAMGAKLVEDVLLRIAHGVYT
ncbi:MAG TPA: antitoxin Xre/MbcA/ParS toxin-binding domain-containing protein [Gemmatimonadota bacterium]|nr:antitoxin Xre/MbcA/ParS toxin-binding domain-containing protein [Gemmatimonadota bacterium]